MPENYSDNKLNGTVPQREEIKETLETIDISPDTHNSKKSSSEYPIHQEENMAHVAALDNNDDSSIFSLQLGTQLPHINTTPLRVQIFLVFILKGRLLIKKKKVPKWPIIFKCPVLNF